MQKILLWFSWLVTLSALVYFSLFLAQAIAFPIWILILFFVLSEALPLGWIARIIPHNTANSRLSMSAWSVFCAALIFFYFFCVGVVITTSFPLLISDLTIIVGVGGGVAIYKALVMVNLLTVYDK